MSLLRFENVSKVYFFGKVKIFALKGINLTVKKNSFLSILGPSGSGKSTLLHIIGFLDKPTEGKIYFKEKEITSFSEDEIAEIRGKEIGFVFQQFNLLDNLTALENIALPMVFQKVKEGERLKRAKELLKTVGLEKRIYHRPNELSGGEQQRVAIARALANDPEIIIADEPTGNLDSESGKIIMTLFKRLYQNLKKTLIIVTHDPKIASSASKILFLRDGKFVKGKEKNFLWKK